MAAAGGGGGASPRGPKPKSPPDLYGKRRQLAKVQLLEREITFLEEELKTLDRVQPTSRCCKEVDEFVSSRPDPLIQLKQNSRKSGCCSCSCSAKKIWGKSCFKSSWICCCFNGKSCSLGTSNCCTCSCSTSNCCSCSTPNCSSCFTPNCCSCPTPNCSSCLTANCCSCQSEDTHHRDHQHHQHGADGTTNAVENAGCCLCDCIEQICCQPCCCFPVLSGSATHECCCNFRLSCSCLKGIGCCSVKGISCCCRKRSSCKPKCCSRGCSCSSSCCC